MLETPGSWKYLEQCAYRIPSMGGDKLEPWLERFADLKPDDSIVELGTWLGAGTSQLALLDMKMGHQNPIHTYDKFIVTKDQVRKTAGCLTMYQDVLSIVQKNLSPFPVPIFFHQGWIGDAEWSGQPIGLYVDDACKRKDDFLRALRTFAPSWIPHRTLVILMDFYYFEKKASPGLDYQFRYWQKNPILDLIMRVEDSSIGLFRYMGGFDTEAE